MIGKVSTGLHVRPQMPGQAVWTLQACGLHNAVCKAGMRGGENIGMLFLSLILLTVTLYLMYNVHNILIEWYVVS